MLKWPSVHGIITGETPLAVNNSTYCLAPNYLSNVFNKDSSRDILILRISVADLYGPLMITKRVRSLFAFSGAIKRS